MKEKGRIIGSLRNLAMAGVIIPFAVSGQVGEENLQDRSNQESTEETRASNSFLTQFDNYLETDYGKAIAYSLLAFSVFSSFYRLQKSREMDSSRKFSESVLSSAFMIAIASSFVAQTEIDIDPRLTSILIDGFTLSNSVYTLESVYEADRKLAKKISALSGILAVAALSTIVSLDSFKNS